MMLSLISTTPLLKLKRIITATKHDFGKVNNGLVHFHSSSAVVETINQAAEKAAAVVTTPKKKDKKPVDLRPWNKVFFPSQRVVLVYPPTPDPATKELHFRVPISMSKHEIKDYLTQVHGFDIKKVNTANYLGKLKSPFMATGASARQYRKPAYKKAIVSIVPTEVRTARQQQAEGKEKI